MLLVMAKEQGFPFSINVKPHLFKRVVEKLGLKLAEDRDNFSQRGVGRLAKQRVKLPPQKAKNPDLVT